MKQYQKQLKQQFRLTNSYAPTDNYLNIKLTHIKTAHIYSGKIFLNDSVMNARQIYHFKKLDHPFILTPYGIYSVDGRTAIVYEGYDGLVSTYAQKTLEADTAIEAIGQICSAIIYVMQQEQINFMIDPSKIVYIKKGSQTVFKLIGVGSNNNKTSQNKKNIIDLVNFIMGGASKTILDVLAPFNDELKTFEQAFEEVCHKNQTLKKYFRIKLPLIKNSQNLLNLIGWTYRDLCVGEFSEVLSEGQRSVFSELLLAGAHSIRKRLGPNQNKISTELWKELQTLSALYAQIPQHIQEQRRLKRNRSQANKIMESLTVFQLSLNLFKPSIRNLKKDLVLRIILVKYCLRLLQTWNLRKLNCFLGLEQQLVNTYSQIKQNCSDLLKLKIFIKKQLAQN